MNTLGVNRAAITHWAALVAAMFTALCTSADEFRSSWPSGLTRTWVGPQYYANRLQDWRVRAGRLECVEAAPQKPIRVLHLLTAAAGDSSGGLRMSVRTGRIERDREANAEACAGFLIGMGSSLVDYRLTALAHHRPAADGGLAAVVDQTGRVAFRDNETNIAKGGNWTISGSLRPGEFAEIPPGKQTTAGLLDDGQIRDVELRLVAESTGTDYELTLSAHDPIDGELLSQATLEHVPAALVDGGVGLVSHLGPIGGKLGHWFADWKIAGSKVAVHPKRTFGPVLCSQYTLSGGTLKMTAQMPPLGAQDTQSAALQIRGGADSQWRTAATGRLVKDSFTITFRVENWDAARDTPFRIVYELKTAPADTQTHYWQGTIRKEPDSSKQFVLAAFTGNKHFNGGLQWNHTAVWFPHKDLVAAVRFHNPDLLFFSGDQIYEGDLTGAQRRPLEQAMLDYHDKWQRWCWAFRGLTRERPCITIPDDHDVYHGNVWGAGGRAAKRPDDGGYIMPPEFVNMVQRTQTSHLPDPYDPTPVEQGIGVYYTRVEYAGVSFAVLEDRKFKSSPTAAVPEGKVVNGWFQNPEFNPAEQADVPGAVLLGERQLRFLRDWSTDWSGGAWMKVALSQTIFANVATIPGKAKSGGVLPGLAIPSAGEYPSGYKLAADADSNGWPQTGRNRAVRELRRGFALHIAGDQHLGSLVHYGVDDWDDAGFAFCVPSIANAWPRRWYPPMPGRGREPGRPEYTGRFLDGFGNHINVYAVSNPVIVGREPARLHNRAPGYGIIRLSRETRDMVIECWPRWADPSKPDARQYPGWPVTINQLDNYGRTAWGTLPPIEVEGMNEPLIRVIDQAADEVVYAVRMRGRTFTPKVFHAGSYTIEVGESGTPRVRTLRDLQAEKEQRPPIRVRF